MTYEVRLTPSAHEVYEQAQKPLARKLARCFAVLENDPRNHPNIRALRGDLAGLHRYRVGDHRVIYRIDDAARVVTVLLIAHRSEAYDA